MYGRKHPHGPRLEMLLDETSFCSTNRLARSPFLQSDLTAKFIISRPTLLLLAGRRPFRCCDAPASHDMDRIHRTSALYFRLICDRILLFHDEE